MKKLLFLFALLFSLNTQAQYKSLFIDSSHWNVYNDIVGLGLLVSYTDSLYLGDTTSINGTKYKEVISNYLSQFSDTIYGYVREDTTLGKAWFLKDSGSTENLIYDLTLIKGDTFRIVDSLLTPQTLEFTVDSTYTIDSRKHLKLTSIGSKFYQMHVNGSSLFSQFSYDSLLLIEGIGSIRGFDNRINSSARPYFIGNSDRLLCAYQKGNRVFRHNLDSIVTDFKDCFYDFTIGIKKETLNKNQIQIFPNPSANRLRLTNKSIKIQSILIFDLMGREQTFVILKHNEFSYELDISQLAVGTYFISVVDESGLASVSKFMKSTN